MMKIGSVTGADNSMQTGRSGMNMQVDFVSKNIQNQIANAQKQLQEVSSREDMTQEEKMKKRQEIQQEITNLNQQLRQRQIEQRKEQQSKGMSMDDMLGVKPRTGSKKSGSKGSGLSQANMQAMISADSSMKQAQVQGNVALAMEDRASVLKAEMKQDGGGTEAKEAELAEIEQKMMNATASQMNTLASANQTIEEAAEAEQGSEEDKEDGKIDSKTGKTEKNGQETGNASENTKDAETNTYTHVDVRL